MQEAKTPFKCETCSEKDKSMRNCDNFLGLSETVIEGSISDAFKEELKAKAKEVGKKQIKKVFPAYGINFYECPLMAITQDTEDLITMFQLKETHEQFYFEGSTSQQPYWYIEALNIGVSELNKKLKRDKDKNGTGKT